MPTHTCTLTHTHTFTVTLLLMQSCTPSFSHTHMHTLIHNHTHPLLDKPNPHLSGSLSWARTGLASSGGCSLLFSLLVLFIFLVMVSIFGEGSIFTLSGNIFPLGCEFCTSVREGSSCHGVAQEG